MKTSIYNFKAIFTLSLVCLFSFSYAQEWQTKTKEDNKSAYVHEVDLSAESTIPLTSGNLAITKQFGYNNSIQIEQNGNQNSLTAQVTQVGSYNDFNLLQEGLENNISAWQVGYSNSIDIDLGGSDNNFGYLQIGHNNEIEHITSQSNGSGAIIQLNSSNKIKLDESGGNYLNGIKIQQNGGMRVNVTTSLKVN